jgi:hypothetical protein
VSSTVVAKRIGTGLLWTAYGLPAVLRRESPRANGELRPRLALDGDATQRRLERPRAIVSTSPDRFDDVLHLDCDADCANCALSVDPAKGEHNSFCRCAKDASISCDTYQRPGYERLRRDEQ